jgi:hypothetical protein
MRLNTRTRSASLVVALLMGVLLSACGGATDNSGSIKLAAGKDVTVPNIRDGLPIVEGGDPDNPMPASAANADERTPVVRSGQITPSWKALNGLLGNDDKYVACAETVLDDFNWDKEVPKYIETEVTNDTRHILVVGSTERQVSKDKARMIASADAGEDLSKLDVAYVPEILNTRGFKAGRCERFIDRRSMVRVSLGQVVYDRDGNVKGIEGDNGIFQDCHNPWSLLPPPEKPAPTPNRPTPERDRPHRPGTTTTTVPGTSTTTTVPGTTTTTVPPCPVIDGVQTERGDDGECYKPERVHDTDGAGGDESEAAQPVRQHPADDVDGADTDDPPPPSDREQDDPDGGSGDGGAGPATGPTDDSHEDDQTTNSGEDSSPSCPFGDGNC